MTKKILVLGSNSFAGSNFIDYCLFKRCRSMQLVDRLKIMYFKNIKNPYLKNLSFLKKM